MRSEPSANGPVHFHPVSPASARTARFPARAPPRFQRPERGMGPEQTQDAPEATTGCARIASAHGGDEPEVDARADMRLKQPEVTLAQQLSDRGADPALVP